MWCYVAAEQLWQDRRRGQRMRVTMSQGYATSRRILDGEVGKVWIETTNTRLASGHGQLQIVARWSCSEEKRKLPYLWWCIETSASKEKSSTLKYTLLNSLVEIILLILSRQVPHLIGSAPQKVIFSPNNLDFLCQFRHSLEQVCHLGRRKKRGEDWERTKKSTYVNIARERLTRPKSDTWKMGASASLLIATIT